MVIGDGMEEAEEQEYVFHKKLKIKLKQQGKEGKIEFLKEYLDYLLHKNKTIPPDFPAFVREIFGLDEREGFVHIGIWHERSELVEFAKSMNYEYKIDHYD